MTNAATEGIRSNGQTPLNFDAVVVGAGWAGMYMLIRLRELGLSARVFEAGSGVGGTWYWNRYPGARCDVPSLDYSYSFSEELQQEWQWSERYAAQEEIERYANHVADRFDLRRDIQLQTRVESASYDEPSRRWTIRTDKGDLVSARYCIMATGGYSIPIKPDIPGVDTFAGEMYYTSRWPKTPVDFAGKRIGVIGTGSSGMQTATAVATEGVDHLYVFQRTPNYAVPARNHPLDLEFQREFKQRYDDHRRRARQSNFGIPFPQGDRSATAYSDEEFQKRMQEVWEPGGSAILAAFTDILVNEDSNRRVSEYLRSTIRKRVNDPVVAEKLCAKTHFLGSRRLLVEDTYFEIFNEPNVTLVDVSESPIVEISPNGLRTAEAEYELDMLILATGFDSGTGALLQVDIRGRDGQQIKDTWAAGPQTYLGVMIHGYPNLFSIAGPGSPSIRSQVILSIEQHVDWITDLLAHAERNNIVEIEATAEAEDAWTAHVADVAASTLTIRDRTQYVGANIPGKPRVYLAYLGGVGRYRKICDTVRSHGYEGLEFRSASGASFCSDKRWTGLDQPAAEPLMPSAI
jgi:cyclohexanone monooxygenase